MSKRWTFDEDLLLFAYFEAVGDHVGTHDLGRPAGAATKRVAKLKACGAWDALNRRLDAEMDYMIAVAAPNRDDRDSLAELHRTIEESTDPDGEIYGHRG